MVFNYVISHTAYPTSSLWIHVFIYKSFRLEQNHFTCDEVGYVFAFLSCLSDQELNIALEEFKRTMVDVSKLFLPQLENRLDRTIICAAVDLGAMRFAMFILQNVCLKYLRCYV